MGALEGALRVLGPELDALDRARNRHLPAVDHIDGAEPLPSSSDPRLGSRVGPTVGEEMVGATVVSPRWWSPHAGIAVPRSPDRQRGSTTSTNRSCASPTYERARAWPPRRIPLRMAVQGCVLRPLCVGDGGSRPLESIVE
jgi:hypothetical protein